MAVVNLDRIDNLSMVEKQGTVRSLTRKARVIFANGEWPNDFTVLTDALTAEGMPQPFTTLADPFASLVLVERSPAIAEGDPGVVDVILKYEHILDGPNQQLSRPPSGVIYGKGRCSIQEKSTNFYYPFGDQTKNKQQITVAHTYPEGDTRASVLKFTDPTLPRTITQGGEISIPFPQANVQFNGILGASGLPVNPWNIAQQFIAKVNENTWLGYPPITWICSEVQWEVMDVTSSIYRFGFEFQYDSDTWDRIVAFNDQGTGRPPANLEAATIVDSNGVTRLVLNSINGKEQTAGYWSVPALGRVNFDTLFGAIFEGYVPPQMN